MKTALFATMLFLGSAFFSLAQAAETDAKTIVNYILAAAIGTLFVLILVLILLCIAKVIRKFVAW
jgi:hypothetical protein